jgi:glutathione S-transferase
MPSRRFYGSVQPLHNGESVLKIWGRINSVNVQKVVWTAEELGVAYQRVDAGMKFGIVDEPEYRGMNPNGRIPTIEDDGLVLWESNAIVRYLAAKYGEGQLWPVKPEARADADRWMDWCVTTIAPVITPLFQGLIRTPPEQRNTKGIDEARNKMEELAAILDAQLAPKPFIAGDTLTMGDIPIGCFMHRWYALPMERPSLVNLAAWYQRLGERPAYRKYVMLPLS